ncbi:MAG: MFS transporter [Ignavibacteriae bacterium]|nr:MAG: MFS transporter [Ignavibacteriota bacterium]
MTASSPSRRPSWQKTFSALKHRNYRLWFWGQMISLFGTWMQMTAQGFLVYELTHSSAFLGYVGFASGIPSWLFTMVGGVVADRMSRRRLLIITQLAMMIQALILAALAFFGIVQPWHILVLAFGLGMANAFDAPTRLAFISEMVDRDDLTNAVALNATMFNSAIIVGPAVAGIIYAAFGPGWCFIINGFSFVAVIAALMAMRLQPQERAGQQTSTLSALIEGVSYVRHQPVIRTLIGLVAAVCLFGMALGTLIPAWSVKILHGNAATNGMLFSARGVGSLIGALAIASLGQSASRGKLIMGGSLFFPVFIALFALVHILPASLFLMMFIGFASIFVLNLSNATIQSLTPDNLRGRVMGVYSTIFMGSIPIGSILLGTMAEQIGEAPAAFISAAAAFIFAGAVWLFGPNIRSLD